MIRYKRRALRVVGVPGDKDRRVWVVVTDSWSLHDAMK
jgi:hypothetical protein